MQWANGDRYKGGIHNQNPDGYGKKHFHNNSTYEGDWKLGLFEGLGTYSWPNGQIYVGRIILIQETIKMELSMDMVNFFI